MECICALLYAFQVEWFGHVSQPEKYSVRKTTGKRKWQKSRHRALFIPKEGKETLEVNLKKGKDKTGSRNQILGSGVGYAKGRY